jgi:hypothetical protein
MQQEALPHPFLRVLLLAHSQQYAHLLRPLTLCAGVGVRVATVVPNGPEAGTLVLALANYAQCAPINACMQVCVDVMCVCESWASVRVVGSAYAA